MGNFKMIFYSKIFLAKISLLFFYHIAFGQKSDSVIAKRHLTVLQIDSICKFIDDNKNLVEGIAEGEFYKQKGGWETYDLKNKKMDTLFRILHNSSTDLYYKTAFYYSNKKVIKATIKIEDRNSGTTMKPVYSATYYFEDDKPIKVQNEESKYSTASEILKQGQNYNDNFYNTR